MARGTARASLAALDDEPGGAAAMQTALDAWRAAALPLDHAFATLCAQHVLPTEQSPEADVQRARVYLEERRADSLLRLFDAASGSHDRGDDRVPAP
jgi:hypothetical protein